MNYKTYMPRKYENYKKNYLTYNNKIKTMNLNCIPIKSRVRVDKLLYRSN